ncbi:hypothetical protein E1A91_A01G073700v1 [Gossypium mustelinum]|uniref:Protein kinase domain-containing protein n=1 Tax=Gossypium mustelinum TaxID=34275 RepID=A0A5D3AAG6_GOSMU|nr:hypothetical protein E1A91_A01G073700v1 [Gossypium mustelinum]
MKIGINLRTGLNRRLAAWKNWDDPSPGDFTFGEELQGNPKMVQRKGSEKYYRNGHGFSGTPNLRSNPIFCYYFVWNENEVYYIYSPKNKSVMSRFVLNQTQSVRQRYTWNPETQTWKLFSITPSDLCDRSGICGPNGNCDNNKLPACQCLTSKSLNCKSGDGFIRIGKVKIPETTNSWVNKTMNLKQCRAKCLRNCSCMAYTNLYVRRGGSGCAIWFGNLLDIKQFQSDGQDLYIRLSASEAEQKKKAKVKLAFILGTVIAALLGFLLIVCYTLRSRRKLNDEVKDKNLNDREDKDENEDMALAVFEFRTIAQATDSFSFNNKLGQGGFGPVFKGTLGNGQEIAAKRLSKSSGQGLNEFKNEVKLIAKLQHRNLVRLLGCCIHGDERMLVYEYMPNRSLDLLIFNEPKNFGFWSARTFGGDQIEANPNRVVGTYGYMAPEYAIDGLFSVKLDIFSFGILLLEIISGRKNRGFYHVNQNGNLIKHQHSDKRPSMSSLVLMLGSHTKLPSPKQPRFLFYKKPFEADCSFRNDGLPSRNEISLSLLEAR